MEDRWVMSVSEAAHRLGISRTLAYELDEARTFGMDALFSSVKIYAHAGQRYDPVDGAMQLSYRESPQGQILEEGRPRWPQDPVGGLRRRLAVLEAGAAFTVSTRQGPGGANGRSGSSRQVDTTYAALATDVAAGDTLLIDDGLVKLLVEGFDGGDVRCQVVEGGLVTDRKGINLPGVRVSAPALTDKDVDDLRFALALGVDMVALSFVRRAEDAQAVGAVMDAVGRRVPVIAKLESPRPSTPSRPSSTPSTA